MIRPRKREINFNREFASEMPFYSRMIAFRRFQARRNSLNRVTPTRENPNGFRSRDRRLTLAISFDLVVVRGG